MITEKDSVRIEHGDNLEDDMLSETGGDGVGGDEEVDETLGNTLRVRLGSTLKVRMGNTLRVRLGNTFSIRRKENIDLR